TVADATTERGARRRRCSRRAADPPGEAGARLLCDRARPGPPGDRALRQSSRSRDHGVSPLSGKSPTRVVSPRTDAAAARSAPAAEKRLQATGYGLPERRAAPFVIAAERETESPVKASAWAPLP